ncbi:MAG: hypothetical protein ABW063_03960, partial [Caulobacter sp.]
MKRALAASLSLGALCMAAPPAAAESFKVSIPSTAPDAAYDGRVLLVLTAKDGAAPINQVDRTFASAQIVGTDVEGVARGGSAIIALDETGYPAKSLSEVPAGRYFVQAVLHKYDTYKLENGKVVKLPAARGAGQNWRKEPGNLVSTPKQIDFDPKRDGQIDVVLDRVNPPIAEPKDSEFIRHFKVRSDKLSKFWGRDVFIRGHVLVPKDFDKHPEAKYPLAIFHGHFPEDFGGFRTTPPDPNLKCEYSERFNLPCYNKTEQQEAYDFYQQWVSDKFPRMLIVEIDHSNPYYDDSYAVNSANIGPYGDAITHEFIPALEKKYRGLGQGWARFLYGGSTGGWEALGVQVKYPDDYNGAYAACP